jgi:hypothetical protein
MSEIIFVTDPAHDPVGEAAPVFIGQGRGAQYVQVPRFQLGYPHCPDARHKVCLDDAAGIRTLFQGPHEERDMRPGRFCCPPDNRRGTRIPIREQHIAGKQNRGERL